MTADAPVCHCEDFTAQTALGPRAARWVHAAEQKAETPIVLLHEGLGSIGQWKDFPQRLAQATGRAILLYDRQGYGRSPALARTRDARYLHEAALEELPALLSACAVESPILFGHSDGGSIALLYAAHHPTTALIAEAAHAFVEEISLTGIRDAVRVWETTDLKERLARYHGEKTEEIFFAWADTWLSPWFRDWTIESEIGAISCPSLILQGEDDEYGTPEQVHAITRAIGATAEGQLIARCRHIPHLQAMEVVLGVVRRFLDEAC